MIPGGHSHGEWVSYRQEQIDCIFRSVSSCTYNGKCCTLPLSRKAQTSKLTQVPFFSPALPHIPFFEVALPPNTSLSILSFSIISGSPLFPSAMISSIVRNTSQYTISFIKRCYTSIILACDVTLGKMIITRRHTCYS